MATLLDASGRPIDTSALKREQGAPSVTSVRQPYSGGHPAAGLTPGRLARILRDSIDGDPMRYLELAEDMEERDLHYAGVLGIRKRQVAGLDISVEAASDQPEDIAAADLVREVIGRDCFADELIDILDAIGKGFSATEIIWDTSEGQWRPTALRWRDPRFFEFARNDGETLLLRENGPPQPLKPFGWITHVAKAKSGLPIRGGLARAAAWAFLFKAFTVKDWAIFAEAYGQPLRLGKYDGGATEADKEVLLRAVSNIGVDYAAIVPAGMAVEIVESKISGSHELYEKRANWLDQQVSKAVLGQTQTTDATAGGYATARVHDGVREDIETADARQVAATLNRDLARPVVDLNLGPRRAYPKIKISRPDQADVEKLVANVAKLVPLGLKVGMSTMRDKLGLPDPEADEELLGKPAAAFDPELPPARPPVPVRTALQSQQSQVATDAIDRAVASILADEGWESLVGPIVADIEMKLAGAQDLSEIRAIMMAHIEQMDVGVLADKLAQAAFAARLAGEVDDGL
ncbi:MAG: DUF935 domain-containing protein [Bosea sp.]|uniref:DUF935 domain-containing protein n=1 Tax=Bosea sp. (in: a-proteobacteria) TaxID=1871050 RepID=UPI001AC2B062|nr:DUF935 domain-containing protein [Bosea sp. (in: a-proteobacteria)]MBN9471677.1 DUF935 domain-containing protein [Bosea sp. (in: a-proteobacteria)]